MRYECVTCMIWDNVANKLHIVQIYSGITSGRVLDGELLYAEILEVNLFAFAYRLFHEDFSLTSLVNWKGEIFMQESVGRCK